MNQAVTCVGLSHRTLLAVNYNIRICALGHFSGKSLLEIRTNNRHYVISFPNVNVGLMLVIPCESVGVVVLVGLGEPRMENMLA